MNFVEENKSINWDSKEKINEFIKKFNQIINRRTFKKYKKELDLNEISLVQKNYGEILYDIKEPQNSLLRDLYENKQTIEDFVEEMESLNKEAFSEKTIDHILTTNYPQSLSSLDKSYWSKINILIRKDYWKNFSLKPIKIETFKQNLLTINEQAKGIYNSDFFEKFDKITSVESNFKTYINEITAYLCEKKIIINTEWVKKPKSKKLIISKKKNIHKKTEFVKNILKDLKKIDDKIFKKINELKKNENTRKELIDMMSQNLKELENKLKHKFFEDYKEETEKIRTNLNSKLKALEKTTKKSKENILSLEKRLNVIKKQDLNPQYIEYKKLTESLDEEIKENLLDKKTVLNDIIKHLSNKMQTKEINNFEFYIELNLGSGNSDQIFLHTKNGGQTFDKVVYIDKYYKKNWKYIDLDTKKNYETI